MNKQYLAPKAFKQSPTLEVSTWYKGILTTQLASELDTGGALDLVLSNMRKGTEPPPHVHANEDEFFYILDGELKAYVEGKVLHVKVGDCLFLPKTKPHAFLIQSPKLQALVWMTPGGFMNAIREMAAPAGEMKIPDDDAVTYSTANLEETMKVFEKYGVRLLTTEEIAEQMPQYLTASKA